MTTEFAARQHAEGFNGLLLSDLSGFSDGWSRPTAARIAEQLAIARAYEMSVILSLPAAGLSFDAVRERLRLWNRHDRGDIAGVFFVHDDVALLETPISEQRQWLTIAREIVPDIPVLGIIGEFALRRTERTYWDPNAFDHVLWIAYPYNLGYTWNRSLDHTAASDPDGELTRYLVDYTAAMKRAVFDTLAPGQLIIPIVQTFAYEGEPAGSIPRPRDITLQVRTLHHELQTTLGQRDNFAMTYFCAMKTNLNVPYPEPLGIYNFEGWIDAVVRANRWLELRRNVAETDREGRPSNRPTASAPAAPRTARGSSNPPR